MSSNQWQRIEELFHAALHLPVGDRPTFLDSECHDDPTLREEVMSLIAASEANENFIEDPALSLGFKVLSSTATRSLLNQSVGHYKLLKLLGSGGMGDVYLADDCTLGRPVALKFLNRSLVDDDWAKSQLLKEARAIAQLENPNICTIHGLEEIDEHNFIVMQYVEGETLHSLMNNGPLELDRALDFAEQIASALTSAHQRSIIHRDVKPQNIVVTPEGLIKVLDFGLAKFVKPPEGTRLSERKADQTSLAAGVVGTVAYMSPEQTRGEELDSRSDIFSFGIVLYQMLSGRNPFLRDSKSETLVAIQEEDPPSLPKGTADSLVGIVRRCLSKDRVNRYETTEEMLDAIRIVREKRRRSLSGYVKQLRSHRHFSKYAAAALVLLLCMLTAGGFLYAKAFRNYSLAVVPITNLSGDSRLDYLTTGLTQNLSDKFSYLPRLKVKSPTTVPLKRREDIVNAGRSLDVEALVSGEILKQGESLKLHLRVLNTADGSVTLDRTFDVDQANLGKLQDDITNEVTSALGLWLIGREKTLLSKRQTSDQEALTAYTHGRYYWSLKRDRENLQKAISFFDRAIDLDPAFAKAYAGRADCYALRAANVLYGPESPKEAMEKASYDARQALELDPLLPEPHTSMGMIRFRHDWDWQEAEKDFQRAIRLDPKYAPAHYWYSNLLAVMGRFDESIRESEIGRSLDPYAPMSAINYGRALYYARRYEEAANYLQSTFAGNSDYPQYLHVMGYLSVQRGRVDEAISLLEKLYSLNPAHAAAGLGFAYGKAGRTEDAARILRFLEESKEPVPPHEKALVNIGIGNLDQAFAFLQQSYDLRFASITFLATDPVYDGLRADPRFAELARRANLIP